MTVIINFSYKQTFGSFIFKISAVFNFIEKSLSDINFQAFR